ncbi:phage antirepressor KilAC domain-containing protein [Arthrobacter sp. M4]|uniref:phage antirepressor n=1 Tax=Arthrobacter sp. M4 TaxID=218160 RepID=UPI001CDC104D|nr:phage antirepressor KilAC domain-containing protein [Arthrobacter sp. M4]MCA4132949.1 phage antirepressor KilAC domain-containing protein [Arthrobacter sp. M4]
MNAIQQFTYAGQTIRTENIDGAPWFVAADVAAVLGYSATAALTRRLDDDDKGVRDLHTPGGRQSMAVISEPGLFAAILGSQVPGAKAFKRWVTHEVLPEIRNTGSYRADQAHQLPQSFAEALRQLADTCEQLEAVAPKVEAYDALIDSAGLYSMQAAAKALGWGPNILFRDLRRLGILQSNNLPYARYMDHFDVKLGSYTNRRGETVPTTTTMVRPSGLDFLRRKLARSEAYIAAEIAN